MHQGYFYCICSLGLKFVSTHDLFYGADFGQMYLLVSSTEKEMAELRERFERHVLTQDIVSVERYHETAQSVMSHSKLLSSK